MIRSEIILSVLREGDRHLVQRTDLTKEEILPETETAFYTVENSVRIDFLRGATGRSAMPAATSSQILISPTLHTATLAELNDNSGALDAGGKMKKSRVLLLVTSVALLLFFSPAALAQARRNLMVARVGYNSLKAVAKPQGELKAKIDQIDKELADATRQGRTGEVRHLLAKGIALLSGRQWDDILEFSTSLVLRGDAVILDSGKPATLRLEQIYEPKVELAGPLTAQVAIYKPSVRPQTAAVGEKVKDLAMFEAVGRDFIDDPLQIEMNLAGIADGTYVIQVELHRKGSPFGAAALNVSLVRGLEQRLTRIEDGLRKVRGFDTLRAEALYPSDRIRNINRGRIEMAGFDVEKELARAEEALTLLRSKRDPFAGRTGDLERHYRLAEADEIMPYRVYIPTKYDGKSPLPLIIALHGLGATQASFFDAYGREFPKLAEQHGYIVAAPLGYRVDGAYGFSLLRTAENVADARKVELSEKDVMQVLERMKKDYRIDERRIYLAGHSMGAIGTWYLAAKYPDIWAAIAPFSGYGIPANAAKMKGIPAIVVHGDADPTVPVAGSRTMVEALKKLGVDYTYIEVPGGNHMNVVQPNFGAAFDFFDRHCKNAP